MDKSLHLDLNLDKHLDATLVIECPVCGHEITHHFRSLEPDSVLVCSQCAMLPATHCTLKRQTIPPAAPCLPKGQPQAACAKSGTPMAQPWPTGPMWDAALVLAR
mgnify:CR=1 FL=1